jgi:hypothetical protein
MTVEIEQRTFEEEDTWTAMDDRTLDSYVQSLPSLHSVTPCNAVVRA